MVDYATIDDVIHRLGVESLEIKLRNISGTFQAGETITGATSSATAKVISYDSSNSLLKVLWVSGKFTYNEQITGGTSAATANIVYAESTLIQDLIDAAENLIDEFCQTKFGDNTLTETEYQDPENDQTDIWLKHRPIVSVSSITFKGDSLGTENTDYWIYPELGLIKVKKGKIYATDPKSLKINYTWGSSTIPSTIQQACVEMVVNAFEDYRRYKNLAGADELTMADFRVKFTKRVMLTEEIEKMLAKHRKLRFAAI